MKLSNILVNNRSIHELVLEYLVIPVMHCFKPVTCSSHLTCLASADFFSAILRLKSPSKIISEFGKIAFQ